MATLSKEHLISVTSGSQQYQPYPCNEKSAFKVRCFLSVSLYLVASYRKPNSKLPVCPLGRNHGHKSRLVQQLRDDIKGQAPAFFLLHLPLHVTVFFMITKWLVQP